MDLWFIDYLLFETGCVANLKRTEFAAGISNCWLTHEASPHRAVVGSLGDVKHSHCIFSCEGFLTEWHTFLRSH